MRHPVQTAASGRRIQIERIQLTKTLELNPLRREFQVEFYPEDAPRDRQAWWAIAANETEARDEILGRL